MKTDVRWVDCSEHVRTQVQPVVLLERATHGEARNDGFIGEYITLAGTAFPEGDEKIVWTLTREGKHVRVPMMGYRAVSRSAAGILLCGIEYGAAVMASFLQTHGTLPLEMCLVLGHECTDLHPQADAYRGYAGVSFRIK